MNRVLRIAAMLAAVFAAQITKCADIPVFPTGPVFKLSGLTWGTSTPPGFNNNFFFTPLSQNESVCVYVKNNNTTSAHIFTATISITSDPSNSTPSDGTWQIGANSSLNAPISPGFSAGIGTSISGVSQVSINFSGSTTQAGSPETANISIIQTQGNCFSGNQFTGSAPSTVSATIPLQAISDGLSQGFMVSQSVTNPAANPAIIEVHNTAGNSKTIFYNKAIISCSAACIIAINSLQGNAGTCSGSSIGNLKISSAVTSVASANNTCTVNPNQAFQFVSGFPIGAGGSLILDLQGLIAPPTAINGLWIQANTFTGTISASLLWYEK